MLIQRLARPIASRAFLLILCACAGQALIPAKGPSPGAPDSLGRLSEGAVISDVTVPGHPSFTEYLGINDVGDIALDAGNGKPTSAYVARRPYHPSDFQKEAAPGAASTTVTALNNLGTHVGFYTDLHGNVVAFSERRGVWSHYAKGSRATEYLGVNDSGTAVGFFTDVRGVNHAFARDLTTGKVTRVGGAGDGATATAINDNGDIVGYVAAGGKSVKGFLSSKGSFTTFSYPGALETKPFGVAKNGDIVGTYVSSLNKSHGFIVKDLAASVPRWRTFDYPNAHNFTALTAIDAHGNVAGYYRNKESKVRGFLCCSPQESSIPTVIPVWGLGGDPTDTDPGAIPDQHLFGVIEDSGYTTTPSLGKNCPGVSSTSTCQPYKYVDLLYDSCNTPVTLAAYQWADKNDETAFQHIYPNATTANNRIEWMATPNPSGPDCKPDNQNSAMRMNAGDSAYNSYLYKNVWNGTNSVYDFPAPYGVFEDQASVFAGIVVGGDGQVSTEYGSGITPSGFANQPGNSNYHQATDWESALGVFVNGACASTCLNVGLNSVGTGYGDVGPCKVIANGHCHAQYSSGEIDNQANFDNICNTVNGGNLKYLLAERPIYAGRFGYEFLDYHTVSVEINTVANLYSHTSDGCANTKIVALEPSYGEAGLGDVKGGYQVRLATLAFRFLVPNPSTSIPDRVISFQLTEHETKTEVPYFFEDTLVPAGAETPVSKYAWNGTVVTEGSGCPSSYGDSGGTVSLVVQCVGSEGIYCQQYGHLYINGADYGKMAACLNTSTTTENITSSWFKNDPIGSYSYELSLQGGEMTSVPFQGVSGNSIKLSTCTNKTYCTGQNTLSTQVVPFKGNGSDQLCGQCGVILLETD